MDYTFIISKLKQNSETFKSLLKGLDKDEYSWKPAPEKWCMLEVICHLYDEEQHDFRPRIKHTLETPESPMPPIDPISWVLAHKYIEQDFEKKLDEFLHEREQSINWLNSLQNPNWNSTYQHPKMGNLKARLFLDNWLAHDYLHIRQIIAIRYQYLCANTEERMDYAGNW